MEDDNKEIIENENKEKISEIKSDLLSMVNEVLVEIDIKPIKTLVEINNILLTAKSVTSEVKEIKDLMDENPNLTVKDVLRERLGEKAFQEVEKEVKEESFEEVFFYTDKNSKRKFRWKETIIVFLLFGLFLAFIVFIFIFGVIYSQIH